MKIKILQTQSKTRARKASFGFTLVETMVATMVAAIMLSTHYLAFASGFALLTVTREDLRASQIMLQRMEAIRVSGYSQLTNSTKFPPTVTEYYSEKDKASGNGGVPYTVSYQAAAATVNNLQLYYNTNMMEVTVGVSWKSGTSTRSRSMKSYVARYGIQSYVSGNR
jgi:type II secretory pathway pseudopilin PulG